MQSHGPLSRTHKLFYQNGALSTEIGPCTTRYFASEAGVVAQCTPGASTSLYRVDQLMTVLGTTDGPHQQRFTVYGFPAPGSFNTPLGFTGQRFNAMSGCYPLGHGHRWFNPRVMRFGQSDSLSPFGKGGVNSYAYCQNDPVNRLDPNGRIWHLIRRAGNWFLQSIYPAPEAPSTVRPSTPANNSGRPLRTNLAPDTIINMQHQNPGEGIANNPTHLERIATTITSTTERYPTFTEIYSDNFSISPLTASIASITVSFSAFFLTGSATVGYVAGPTVATTMFIGGSRWVREHLTTLVSRTRGAS